MLKEVGFITSTYSSEDLRGKYIAAPWMFISLGATLAAGKHNTVDTIDVTDENSHCAGPNYRGHKKENQYSCICVYNNYRSANIWSMYSSVTGQTTTDTKKRWQSDCQVPKEIVAGRARNLENIRY